MIGDKKNIKTVSTTTEILVDSESGEVLDISINKVQICIDEDKFALVYVSLWDSITESNLSKTDIEMFGYLINHYGDGTKFTIAAEIKLEVANKANKSPTSYDKCAKNLLTANFILKVGFRLYQINPRYAFKGSSNNRKKLIVELSQKHKIY